METSQRLVRVLLLAAVQMILQRVAMAAPQLVCGSTLGGSQAETIRAIATDSAQNIYVVGETYSADFPGATAASGSRFLGDAFVVKLNTSCTQILYTVILGGSGYDSALAIAVDSAGNAYITGVTTSPNFPVTNGAWQRASGSSGLEDAFVAKLSPAGTVVYATYLGGFGSDTGFAIALDQSGAAYVAGSTNSQNFPVTHNAPQGTFQGGVDCFVAKLDPTGSTLAYSTYLGGENIDVCKGIAVDQTGAAFVTGTTASSRFPVLLPLKPRLTGPYDAFLTKLAPGGDHWLFSTYLGGESVDEGNVVRLDSLGRVYIAGDTTSTAFPVTSGAMQKQLNGGYDGFVCSLTNDGSQVLFATYLGGGKSDSISDLFVAPDGRIGVTGYTASPDFPLMNPFQTIFGGSFDGFVAVLGQNGITLDFASYLGGPDDDRAYGVASLGSGQLVVTGQMLSGTIPYLPGNFAVIPSGQYDGFLASVSYALPLRFVPVTPCRVADTRNVAGPFGGPAINGGGTRDFIIPSSACAIPATARAYSLNVAVVPSGPLGYLTLWPSGQTQPVASTLNSLDGRIKSNAAIVPAGAGGAVSVFASNPTDVVLEVNGYFVAATDPTALAFYPVIPCRVADTRLPVGLLGGPSLGGGQSRTFPIPSAAACNIPGGAQAYSLNFAAVPKGPLGYITAWPTGHTMPVASSLNAITGTVTANAVIVAAGTGGAIDIFASNATDLVIDINGYFAPMAAGGLSLYNVTPCRVLDTRQPAGASAVAGRRDVPIPASACGIPAAAKAHVLGATVVPSGAFGYLTLWPQGQSQPSVSTLNALDGAITSNLAIVPTTNGTISAWSTNPSYLVLDVFGYFAQ